MKKLMILILSCLMLSSCIPIFAFNGVDPARAATILLFSEEAKKMLEAQERAQMLMATGHLWIKEEVKQTRRFQEEFNDYLDTFQGVISKCVQIYGIYYEVNRCTASINALTSTVNAAPTNALAVAWSSNRNKFYRLVIDATIEVVGDIKVLVLDSKMTEHERFKILENMQPKLRNLNNLIRKLTITIRYTTLADVWREITGRTYKPKTRKEICIKCQKDWATNYKRVKI